MIQWFIRIVIYDICVSTIAEVLGVDAGSLTGSAAAEAE